MADVLLIQVILSAQHTEWLGGVLGGPGGFACWCRVCFFALVHLHGMRVWCAWMSMRVGLASQGSCAGWFGTPPAPRPPTLCMLVRSMACHVFVSYSVVTFTAWCTGVKHVGFACPVTSETMDTCYIYIAWQSLTLTSCGFPEKTASLARTKSLQRCKFRLYTCCVSNRKAALTQCAP